MCVVSCTGPKRFASGGTASTTFFTQVDKKREDSNYLYHYKRAIIDLPVKHHLIGVPLACQCWPNIECWLDSFVVLQGIQTSIYVFLVLQGCRTHCPPIDRYMIIFSSCCLMVCGLIFWHCPITFACFGVCEPHSLLQNCTLTQPRLIFHCLWMHLSMKMLMRWPINL